MSVNTSNILKTAYQQASNDFSYAKGMRIFDRQYLLHPKVFTDELLCNYGLLCDHLALSKKPHERSALEAKARRLYRRALTLQPKSRRAVWGLGRIFWHHKDARALPYARRAFVLAKQSGNSMGISAQNIGFVYESLGKFKRAEYWLQKGVEVEPNGEWGVYMNIISFYGRRGEFDKFRPYVKHLKDLYCREQDALKKTQWGSTIERLIEAAEQAGKK